TSCRSSGSMTFRSASRICTSKSMAASYRAARWNAPPAPPDRRVRWAGARSGGGLAMIKAGERGVLDIRAMVEVQRHGGSITEALAAEEATGTPRRPALGRAGSLVSGRRSAEMLDVSRRAGLLVKHDGDVAAALLEDLTLTRHAARGAHTLDDAGFLTRLLS